MLTPQRALPAGRSWSSLLTDSGQGVPVTLLSGTLPEHPYYREVLGHSAGVRPASSSFSASQHSGVLPEADPGLLLTSHPPFPTHTVLPKRVRKPLRKTGVPGVGTGAAL